MLEQTANHVPLPILMYHGIHTSSQSSGLYNTRYSVTPEDFGAHLDWLLDHGFHTALLTCPTRTSRDIVLTFDDGDESAVSVTLPMLVERGMVAEFAIPSDYVGRPGCLSRQQVRQLADAGMAIQSHGRTHRLLPTLSAPELAEELTASRCELEDWSGRAVASLSVPGGRGGMRELRAAQAAGYEFVLNSVPGPNHRIWLGRYLRRTVITSSTSLDDFADLVLWRGWARSRLVFRTAALGVPKRVLGDQRYTRLRALVPR